MSGIEEAFERTEETAQELQSAAARVASRARALVKAGQTGNLAAVKRSWMQLREDSQALSNRLEESDPLWPFTEEEERALFSDGYATELKAEAEASGLRMFERDGNLMCYPSILRVLPDFAVRIDRKKVSTVRPSWLVRLLLKRQQKTSGYPPQRFLEALYSVYGELRRDSSGLLGSDVVPLVRIYGLLTALPGAQRDYDRTDFARDLYVLESEGPRQTKKGASVSFPSSTGTRRKSEIFSFVGPDGDVVEYYGIRFTSPSR